ncbi:hypothetical protein KY284_012667 [Solanum tuberosum]|nr:hypothetical protein KY284_012667 [Solanum tuberosum]
MGLCRHHRRSTCGVGQHQPRSARFGQATSANGRRLQRRHASIRHDLYASIKRRRPTEGNIS